MNIKDDINPWVMRSAAVEASDLLKALSSQHRLNILLQLIYGEKSVGQLARLLGIRSSTVSQHLARLRREGIVDSCREGQSIHYRIESAAALALMEVICEYERVQSSTAIDRTSRIEMHKS